MCTVLQDVAKRENKTLAQVALNWVVCQGAVPLAGAKTEAQAIENAGALGWRLSPSDVALLTSAGCAGKTSDWQHG